MLNTSSLSTSRTESTAAVTPPTAIVNSSASRNDTESLVRKAKVGQQKKEIEVGETKRVLKNHKCGWKAGGDS
ncbi:hypothetical protein HPP92_017682 [Vanilla planifolia]|uniref:Uncharacterized protein n=1 Tax=Vanilla planifolia TaxID=51239 RepID=A0A835ULJ9_VANPL|nr:hypothetical protein HPP92_017682 [Vanilla planifolia]